VVDNQDLLSTPYRPFANYRIKVRASLKSLALSRSVLLAVLSYSNGLLLDVIFPTAPNLVPAFRTAQFVGEGVHCILVPAGPIEIVDGPIKFVDWADFNC
jgi:hypothetical protein